MPQPTLPQQQQAQSQGVLPALFGFQLGPGQGYVEAMTPEQQHQVGWPSNRTECCMHGQCHGMDAWLHGGRLAQVAAAWNMDRL
jgi:hypothetical protein